jgi:hypothetical protein
MSSQSVVKTGAGWLAAGAGLAAGAYAGYVTFTWNRYGKVPWPSDEERDPLLDRFMPVYEVVDRHHIRIAAPAAVTLAAARDMDVARSAVARAIFRTRELILGAMPEARPRPRALLEELLSLGWSVLAEIPGREIVVGAVTKPWEANVTFRSIPPDEFAAFAEPDYVKIAWTLRADPIGEATSIFRTETRAVATDPVARAKFRWYWSFLSPGISLIRLMSLCPLKSEAERRALAPTILTEGEGRRVA